MDWWWGECPYSTKTWEVLGNPSLTPKRFPETREISRGRSPREISRVLMEHRYITGWLGFLSDPALFWDLLILLGKFSLLQTLPRSQNIKKAQSFVPVCLLIKFRQLCSCFENFCCALIESKHQESCVNVCCLSYPSLRLSQKMQLIPPGNISSGRFADACKNVIARESKYQAVWINVSCFSSQSLRFCWKCVVWLTR